MDKKELMNMLKAEVAGKLDKATVEKLKGAKTKDEALSILSKASVELDDELLSAVSGGKEDIGDAWCIDKDCDGLWCPGYDWS